jgi:hypothetical protein
LNGSGSSSGFIIGHEPGKNLRNESPVYPGNAQLPSLVQVVALLVSKWRVGSPGNDAELLVLIVDPLFDTVR